VTPPVGKDSKFVAVAGDDRDARRHRFFKIRALMGLPIDHERFTVPEQRLRPTSSNSRCYDAVERPNGSRVRRTEGDGRAAEEPEVRRRRQAVCPVCR
jgi:hypothetical protein